MNEKEIKTHSGKFFWYTLSEKLLNHIDEIDSRIMDEREKLLSAYRYTECIRTIGSFQKLSEHFYYSTIIREIRFSLESVIQALYIDINHYTASLSSKLEVYKALSDFQGFIAKNLFNRVKVKKSLRKRIRKQYSELSNYVHGSKDEIIQLTSRDINDVLVFHYDENMENFCRKKGIEFVDIVLDISKEFETKYLEKLDLD